MRRQKSKRCGGYTRQGEKCKNIIHPSSKERFYRGQCGQCKGLLDKISALPNPFTGLSIETENLKGITDTSNLLAPLSVKLDKIEKKLEPIISAFTKKGYKFFLVGGVVRDALQENNQPAKTEKEKVKNKVQDIDITTDASPKEIKKIMAKNCDTIWDTGIEYGTVSGKVGNTTIEITTHRKEIYNKKSRKPKVKFTKNVEEDLMRRDFTINALAIQIPERSIVDPSGGIADMRNKILRTPIHPEVSFQEDPLRILRAARFIGSTGFQLETTTKKAMKSTNERLSIIAPERISMETKKIMELPEATRSVMLLKDSGALDLLGVIKKQKPHYKIAVKIIDTLEEPKNEKELHDLRWAALAIIGGHDSSSAKEMLANLRYPRSTFKQVESIVAAKETLLRLLDGKIENYDIRKFLHTYSKQWELLSPALCNTDLATEKKIKILLRKIKRLANEEGVPEKGIPLGGERIIKIAKKKKLGLGGQEIKNILELLLESHYEEGPLSLPQATKIVQSYLRETRKPKVKLPK